MRKLTVADVMTREVVTVAPDTPFKDLVDLLVHNGISAAPVVDAHGAVLGVVSEADLLCRQEHADDEDGAGPSLLSGKRSREHWRKSAGLTARDLMTAPALTVSPEAFLPAVAKLLAQANIRRVVVVQEGQLVGVVSRRDLLRAFLRSDAEIRAEIEHEIFERVLWADLRSVRATVEHGVVTLTGRLEYQADVDIAVHLCKAIPGVVAVKNRLDYFWNGEGDHRGSSTSMTTY